MGPVVLILIADWFKLIDKRDKMKSRSQWFLFFFLILLLSGCAHVISKDLRTKSDLSLTLAQVRQSPEASRGKLVVWDGEIIEASNQEAGTTQIQVFQRPLGWRGEPKETTYSEGRFLVLADNYLDPDVFRRGRRITVAGKIIGEEAKPLGEMETIIFNDTINSFQSSIRRFREERDPSRDCTSWYKIFGVKRDRGVILLGRYSTSQW